MKVLSVLALCIVAASAGVIDHTSCGGAGQVRQIRIEGLEGPIADMVPGTMYPCNADIVPAAASAEIRLKVTTVYLGQTITIIDSVLPNSAVTPGTMYTLNWTITPSTLLSGSTVPVDAAVLDEASQGVLLCATIQVRVA